jgi:hypothetical protein
MEIHNVEHVRIHTDYPHTLTSTYHFNPIDSSQFSINRQGGLPTASMHINKLNEISKQPDWYFTTK